MLAVLPLVLRCCRCRPRRAAVDPMRFFAGFGHPALIAICSLMVLGHALVVTGALEPVARRLAGWVAAAPKLAPLAVMVGAAPVSGAGQRHAGGGAADSAGHRRGQAREGCARHDAAADELRGADRRHGHHHRHLDQPDRRRHRRRPRASARSACSSFYPLVALAAVPALLYLWLVAPRLLAHVQAARPSCCRRRSSKPNCSVEADSWLDGRELREAFKATGHRCSWSSCIAANAC